MGRKAERVSTVEPTRDGLQARIVDVSELGDGERDAMFALMDRFYADMERRRFDDDLARKQWCVLLRSANGELRGFSSQALLETPFEGRVLRTLFSGDTIVERDYWGSPALSTAVARLMLLLIDRHPGERLFWFLTTQGYRTYRFLPLFYREFYPRWDKPTPPWARALIGAVASCGFPAAFDSERSVLHSSDTYRLRPGIGDVSPERLRNRHVRFFHERNPGHPEGDELCCIAPLTRENFTDAMWRIIRSPRFDAVEIVEERAT